MAPPRTKPFAHSLPQLDIWHLQRERRLIPGIILALAWPELGKSCRLLALNDSLEVLSDEGDPDTIELIWRDGTLGGRYPSVRCPNCERSAAMLYQHDDGRFACRACRPVAYRCESESRYDRTLRRAGKLRERLGWHPSVVVPDGDRPWYMNQSTFNRLAAQVDGLTDAALGPVMERLERRAERVGRRRREAERQDPGC